MQQSRLGLLGLVAFFVVFMVYPLTSVLYRAFLVDGSFSLHFFHVMLRTPYYREVVLNSLNLALAVTALTTLVAYPLAFVMARFRVYAASFVHAALLLPLVVPPFVGVLGIRQIFGRFGTINMLLLDSGAITHPIDFLGQGNVSGIIALQVLHLVPVMYLSIRASLGNVHIALEEAARMSGASPWMTLRRIVLPLSYPGWFAGATLVFVASFTDLGTPLVFEYRHVLPVQIFTMLSDLHENPVGYSFVVFACTVCAGLFYVSKDTILQGSFAGSTRLTRTGVITTLSASSTALITGGILCYCIAGALPHIAVGLLAFSDRWFMTALPDQWTLNHIREAWSHTLTVRSLLNSVILSLAASLLTIVVGAGSAFYLARSRSRAIWLLDTLTLLPLAVPGIVFAFGYLGAFAGTPLDNRLNPFPLLIAAYVVRRTPAMVRSVSAGFQEVPQAYEEAALMTGASPFKVFRQIVIPLVQRHIIVGALLTFAYSMLEVSDSLLLAIEAHYFPVSKAMYSLLGRPDGVEVASALGLIVMVIMLGCFITAETVSQRGRKRAHSAALGLATLLAAVSYCSPAHAESREIVAVSPHGEWIKQEFEKAFLSDPRFNDAKMRWLDLGGTSDIVRYVRTQFRASPSGIGIDLIFGGGTDPFLELEHDGHLASLDIDAAVLDGIPPSVAGVPLYSERKEWFAAALATFGILYNKIAVDRMRLPVPSTWSDLARPEYRGLVGAADPRRSGSMHAMYEVILQAYGWEQGWSILRGMARNVRNFSGGASQVGKEIASGEIAFGLSIDTYAGELIKKTGDSRLSYVVPQDFPTVTGDGIAMLKGAPNSALAIKFIEFVLSPRGQRLWYGRRGVDGGPRYHELGKLPIRPALYGTIPTASVVRDSPFTWQTALPYDAARGAGRWGLLNDLFGMFVIDVHDRLTRLPIETPVPPLPVSESSIDALAKGGLWNKDPALRSSVLEQWSAMAREQLEERGVGFGSLRWIPAALFLLGLVVSAITRLSRTRHARRA